jgi:integrase
MTAAVLQPYSTASLYFPARGKPEIPFNGWSKSKALLDKLSGVTGWTLHDLRRTFRSNLGRLGVAPHIAERLVNHVSARTDMEQVYDRYKYLPEMKDAIERHDRFITSLLTS